MVCRDVRYDLAEIVGAKGPRRGRAVRRVLRSRKHLDRHERELIAIFMQVVKFWEERVAWSNTVVTDAVPDPDEVGRVDDAAIVAYLIGRIREWLRNMTAWQRGIWVRQVREATGVDVSAFAEAQDRDPAVVATLLWAESLLEDLSRQTKARVVTSVTESVARGATQAETGIAVKEALEKAKTRARLIGSDMTVKMHAKSNEALQREAGVTKYKWNHSFRKNPRRHHVERQGNIYEWTKPPYDGHPGHAPGCRCTAEPVI